MSENKISVNAPLEPVFSFKVKGGGDIHTYIAETEACRFAVITYNNSNSEVAYALETLQRAYKIEAQLLVEKAIKEWGEGSNPFKQLRRNKKAMKRLADCFYSHM
jgi:hypothetical protein